MDYCGILYRYSCSLDGDYWSLMTPWLFLQCCHDIVVFGLLEKYFNFITSYLIHQNVVCWFQLNIPCNLCLPITATTEERRKLCWSVHAGLQTMMRVHIVRKLTILECCTESNLLTDLIVELIKRRKRHTSQWSMWTFLGSWHHREQCRISTMV